MDKTKSKPNIGQKWYKHFDRILSDKTANQFYESVVLDADKVVKYRFHPFILRYQESKIYHRAQRNHRSYVDYKKRPISLVAHHDELVYSHYSATLNDSYEDYLDRNHLFKVPTAYRKRLKGSNITAAKEIFDAIVNLDDCWIIKGDFKHFFDNIRHSILRKNLCKVLNVTKLPADWAAIFKSLTKYRYVKKTELEPAMKVVFPERNKSDYYTKSHQELGTLLHSGQVKLYGPNQLGIPQGTAISAVLANIYMVELDAKINQLVAAAGGIYRRYSDDFVIVIPKAAHQTEAALDDFITTVKTVCSTATKLTIETHKTKVFSYRSVDGINRKFDHQFHPAWFDYLGFLFNGKVVRMRPKSIYKFHYKSKKMLRHIRKSQVDRFKFENQKSFDWNVHFHKVWFKNAIVDCENSEFKQLLVKTRINKDRQILSHNIPQKRIATKMYLTHRRYGEKYSMVGYAKRAQRIMSSQNNKYQVQIWQPISDQITKNQRYRKGLF
ncbi:reverse transcriptase/maturase family protein [Lactobacillus sp. Sy-1]|uniref:reverse transcriptase/maturase family protein n=1 Tax=Lactobacillus sp. Sy-1 TaxID=2109645 RepID=UPI001C5AD8E8|nr:reverse transcriptase/maturase family protein [Lactobacillus sp. Sy-1]MBW1605860.1 hypothetical protein [Lactobacillus sp. Sy-1]